MVSATTTEAVPIETAHEDMIVGHLRALSYFSYSVLARRTAGLLR